MSAREIINYATENRLFSDRIAGKTPFQTMKAKLSVDIIKNAGNSLFVRTAPGRFFLRSRLGQELKAIPGHELASFPGHEVAEYEAKRYQKPPPIERVLTIPRDEFYRFVSFQGVTKRHSRIQKRLLRPDVCRHIDRLTAEVTDTAKQVLSYVLVTRNDQVLCFQRGNFNRVEDFLRGSSCIGFGGHVAEHDYSLLSDNDMGLRDSARRELLEEINLPEKDKKRLLSNEGLSLVGVLNDDSSVVGRRHVAFIFHYEVSDDPAWEKPQKGEKSIAQLHWITPHEGVHHIWKFEYWSQLCLRQFFPDLAKTASAYRLQRARQLRQASVILVIGALGSGKTEAVRVLSREFGFKEINSGRVLANLIGEPPVSHKSRESFQHKALGFIRKRNGARRLALAIEGELTRLGGGAAVIDGIRQLETFEELRTLLGKRKIAIVYVHTLPDIAYRLYVNRTKAELDFAEFISLREAEVETGVSDFLRIADAVVYNWVGLKAYLKTLQTMFKISGVGTNSSRKS